MSAGLFQNQSFTCFVLATERRSHSCPGVLTRPLNCPGAPFDPANPPPPPPSAWQSMLHAISGIVHFFGRLSFLVDENAHAVHFFIAALLQLLDR